MPDAVAIKMPELLGLHQRFVNLRKALQDHSNVGASLHWVFLRFHVPMMPVMAWQHIDLTWTIMISLMFFLLPCSIP